jgi:hypothetical protein
VLEARPWRALTRLFAPLRPITCHRLGRLNSTTSHKGAPSVARRLALVCTTVVLAGAVGIFLPASANATVTHSSEPAVNDACWSSPCGTGGHAFSDLLSGVASWGGALGPFGGTVTKLGMDSEVIPLPWLVNGLGTIVLGPTAFATGWKIGTTLNAKWFHIQGVGLGTTAGAPAAVDTTSWTKEFNGGLNGFWPDNGYYLSMHVASGSYRVFFNCEAANVTNKANCAAPYASLNEADAAYSYSQTFGAGALKAVTTACPSFCTGTFTYYAIYLSPEDFKRALVTDQPLQPYTSQPSGIQTGWATHGGCGTVTTACAFGTGALNPTPLKDPAQLLADGLSEEDRHKIDCELDPADYVCPEVTADGSGYSSSGGYRHSDGGVVTGPDEEECKFHSDIGGRTLWEQVHEQASEFYDEACEEAWQALKDEGLVDADGYPSELARFSPRKIMSGQYIDNQVVQDAFDANGPPEDWWKVKSRIIRTSSGRDVELHWYQKIAGEDIPSVYLGRDYFAVFMENF